MAAHQAGLQVGAFFILFYPGETNQTVLNTLHFATSLPLDYLGLTMPYPLPGTALYERVKGQIKREWRPGDWKTEAGIAKFVNLIDTYVYNGGYHIQVNTISKDTLRDAQTHPEKYPTLMVRVGRL